MAEESLPPQPAKMALYSAGGGFVGAILAIVVAKILAGPCWCTEGPHADDSRQPATLSAITETLRAPERSPV